MSFAAHLARFREAHPEIEVAEIHVSDFNGVARGKLVPIGMLEKLAGGTMKMPVSTLGLDIFGADVAEAGIALETGDPDGDLVPVEATLAPMVWAGRPTAQLQCMITEAGNGAISGYDPRGVLMRVAERAQAMGYRPVMALELEFYLIDAHEPAPPMNPVAAWGLDNRSVPVRVPENAGKAARVEHRVAGSDATPYLLAAAVLAGALDGIGRGLEPAPPVSLEARPGDAEPLPVSWSMAEQRFSASDFVADWLGPAFRHVFGAMKRQERATLMARVSDVEYDAYLRTV